MCFSASRLICASHHRSIRIRCARGWIFSPHVGALCTGLGAVGIRCSRTNQREGSSIQMLAQDTRAESKALQCPKAIMVELEYSFLSSFTCWRAIQNNASVLFFLCSFSKGKGGLPISSFSLCKSDTGCSVSLYISSLIMLSAEFLYGLSLLPEQFFLKHLPEQFFPSKDKDHMRASLKSHN
ncbi:unnamed protein product [Urochloa humidicola]